MTNEPPASPLSDDPALSARSSEAAASSVKHTGETVRESEARFRLLADSAPVLISVNGLAGCEFVNRAYREFLGVKSDLDLHGYNWAQFVHPEDRDAYVRTHRECFACRTPFEAQFRFRRHDGEYRWMKSIGRPRFSDSGEFIATLRVVWM